MKKNIKLFFSALIILSISVLVFSSCKKAGPFNGRNEELDVTVECAEFDDNAKLTVTRIMEEINIKNIKEKLSGLPYNDTSELFVYYITVVRNGETITPSSTARISLPRPNTEAQDLILYHITEDAVKSIPYTEADGKITFDTKDFMYFVIADPHVHIYSEWTAAEDGENHVRSCECGYVASAPHRFDDVKYTINGKIFTCVDCLYSYTHTHEYGDWTDAKDGKNHTHSCECGNVVSAAHDFDAGTEVDTGTEYTCKSCGYIKSVPVVINVQFITKPFSEASLKVYVNGELISDGTKYSGTLVKSSEIRLVITPNTGYKFDGWEIDGETYSRNKEITFIVGKNDFTFGKEKLIIYANINEKATNSNPLPVV